MHLNESPSHVTPSIHLITVTLINLIKLGVGLFYFLQLHYCYMFRSFRTFNFYIYVWVFLRTLLESHHTTSFSSLLPCFLFTCNFQYNLAITDPSKQ